MKILLKYFVLPFHVRTITEQYPMRPSHLHLYLYVVHNKPRNLIRQLPTKTADCEVTTTVTGAATGRRKLSSPISSRDNVTAGDKNRLIPSSRDAYRYVQPRIIKIILARAEYQKMSNVEH